MAATKIDYQANWRGARRYQFDEEYRLKMAALEEKSQPPAEARILDEPDHNDDAQTLETEATGPVAPEAEASRDIAAVRRLTSIFLLIFAAILIGFALGFADWSKLLREVMVAAP